MIRFGAVLPLVLLMSACTTSPTSSGPPPSSAAPTGWVSLTPPPDRDEQPDVPAIDRPKRIDATANLCELLTDQEITSATAASSVRTGRPVPGTLCLWQLGTAMDDRGAPTEALTVTSSVAGVWGGDEQGVVGGYPARRVVGEGLCTLKVALRRPDSPTDKAVLTVNLSLADKTADPCPVAQKLTETTLDRVPGA